MAQGPAGAGDLAHCRSEVGSRGKAMEADNICFIICPDSTS